MNHYEVVFLVHPDQSDSVPAMIEKYQKLIDDNGGKVHRTEDWGRRQLAYLINDIHKAHYVLLNIECNSKTLSELTNIFRFNDAIMRHLVIKQKQAITGDSVIKSGESNEKLIANPIL
jgi:small subunit ribosomal protein S6